MSHRLPGWNLPLAERLDEAQLAELTRVADETGVSLSMIDTLPLWQIAMVLTGHAGAASGAAG
jgi:uncharacterized protein YbaP (TraB family)